MKNLITCQKADMGYASSRVLSQVDLNIETRKIYCVFGRNGSGKTTLLKSLSGLIPLIDGSIELEGVDLKLLTASELARKRSLVLTGRPLVNSMSVREFVTYGRYPYTNWLGKLQEGDRDKIRSAIQKAGIEGLLNRNLNELSDGEMQKVSIARALSQDTDILFLDEIAAHLDLVNKSEIFALLKEISTRDRRCIVFTSHDIQFSLQLADVFIVLTEGRADVWTQEEFKKNRIFQQVLKSDHLDIDEAGLSIRFK